MKKIIVFCIFTFIGVVNVSAHESKHYTIEDAELVGVCEAVINLMDSGVPVRSPHIKSIINGQKKKFGTSDLKDAIEICVDVFEKKSKRSAKLIGEAIDGALGLNPKK